MTRPPDQDADDIRSLWPLVRMFGILADIAGQANVTGEDVEIAVPLEVAANLVAGSTPTSGVTEEGPTVEKAA
jgi:hypothetical protein